MSGRDSEPPAHLDSPYLRGARHYWYSDGPPFGVVTRTLAANGGTVDWFFLVLTGYGILQLFFLMRCSLDGLLRVVSR